MDDKLFQTSFGRIAAVFGSDRGDSNMSLSVVGSPARPHAKMGPIVLEQSGTVTAHDCRQILLATGCKASVRSRDKAGSGRALTIHGP